MSDLLNAIIWFLPAGFANMAPVLFKKLPFLNIAINKKVFGNNKTWRGIVTGLILGTVAGAIASQFYTFPRNPILFSFLISAGALGGDIIESAIKRRLNIAPGKPFPPWDQMDWILGALLAATLVTTLSGTVFAIALVFYTFIHPIVNLIGYTLRLKKNKF